MALEGTGVSGVITGSLVGTVVITAGAIRPVPVVVWDGIGTNLTGERVVSVVTTGATGEIRAADAARA